ncbi:MAG: GH3 auxin-responsive promoter family protein, partial [Bacteroidia bacterium]|nr:GH3 auxin-responsive promoter family protein [Bacteroidia bacterium]
FRTAPDNIDEFNSRLDAALMSLNSDYEAKRYNDITLRKPTIHQAKPGLFYKWLKKNDKLGGQHKVPRLSNSRIYIEELLGLNH